MFAVVIHFALLQVLHVFTRETKIERIEFIEVCV